MCQLHILLTRAAQICLELHFCVELHTKKSPGLGPKRAGVFLQLSNRNVLHQGRKDDTKIFRYRAADRRISLVFTERFRVVTWPVAPRA